MEIETEICYIMQLRKDNQMAIVNDNELFHPLRRDREAARCVHCPFGADLRGQRINELIKGHTFDLRTTDGLYEGVERLLRACGASVVVG